MTPNQARVLGALIEKSITTPEYYPLSLNALTNACNQKSSRDPVTNLSDTDVQSVCQNLQEKHFVIKESSSRTIKYKHRFFNTEFGELKLSSDQVAVVCVMLLRGNQSAGELKTRCQRLHEFQSNEEVEQTLESLREHALGPFTQQLPKESGKRDVRWAHLFVPGIHDDLVTQTKQKSTSEPVISNDVLQNESSELQKDFKEMDLVAEINALKEQVAVLTLQMAKIQEDNM